MSEGSDIHERGSEGARAAAASDGDVAASTPVGDPATGGGDEAGAPAAPTPDPAVTDGGEASFADAAAPSAPGGESSPDTPGQGEPVESDEDPEVRSRELLALAQRTKADFENFRKRSQRDVAAAGDRGMAKLAKELLPALDHLELALASADADSAAAEFVKGIRLVQDELLKALGRVGIESFSPEGEPFDPARHEAMVSQPSEGAESGTVIQVYQRGYRAGESVLRPARVVVAA